MDPPHLLKTIRNCFQNPIRNLWVSTKCGMNSLLYCSMCVCVCVCVCVYNKVIDFVNLGNLSVMGTTSDGSMLRISI